jgi:hypothetical protein
MSDDLGAHKLTEVKNKAGGLICHEYRWICSPPDVVASAVAP